MRFRFGSPAFLLVVLMAVPAQAADIYAVEFIGPIYISIEPATCLEAGWRDQLILHNATQESQTVRFLGISNAASGSGPSEVLVPPGTTRAVSGFWQPTAQTLEWVVHLDVPPGVLVESRAEPFGGQVPPCVPPPNGAIGPIQVFGALPLPVFTALTPAGQAQIHLGTDLGTDAAHQNVGIYNAGAVPATATIGLHQGCDDALVVQRTATIPPNSIVQVEGLRPPASSCSAANAPEFITYVVVTVDQPSFSYVTTLSDDLPPRIPVGFSYTH